MRVLAIESTCDETAAAVVDGNRKGIEIISSKVASSSEIQAKYGGIVPEVAAREQVRSVIPVIKEALEGVDKKTIDAVAVSYGPGLMGSLLIGVETAKSLALAWNKKLINVNHLEAHISANWFRSPVPDLPAIGLIISGGHSDLVWIHDLNDWEWIGGTLDDAAGEAFDKAARVLGLGYPGGPAIQRAADEAEGERLPDRLPRPMIHDDSLNMSFSGLKAAVAKVAAETKGEKNIRMLAADFNEAVADVLAKKSLMAIAAKKPRSLLVAGGVAANKKIRERLTEMAEAHDVDIFIPEIKYCGDNAAMVGAAAILKPREANIAVLGPDPNLQSAK